ncbi:hypothetical protein [Kribbella sp. CA-247076]|uniref:hypothetical protein n=1 Tax=Kribbella sp. CA-247076 TaxID=3239941 RepID=UPI003D8F9A1B
MELPDEQAPDADLRAARREIQAVGTSLRDALAADDALAAGGEQTNSAGGVQGNAAGGVRGDSQGEVGR